MTATTAIPVGLPDPVSRANGNSRTPAQRLSGVDGLRGLAALIVVLFHMYGAAGGPALRIHHINLLRPLTDGWAAVNLFLVLSGFCLYWPYAPRKDKPLRLFEPRDYIIRRSMRILPTYYASLIFVVLVGALTPLRGHEPHCFPLAWWDVADHALLLNAWVPASMNSWNSVTWSLSVEWTWYAAFPLAMILYRRWGAARGLLVLTFITAAYRIGLYLIAGPINHYPLQMGFALRTFLPGRLFEFGLGMAVAAFISSGGLVPSRFHIPITIGVALCLIMGRLAEPTDGFLPARDMLYGVASALLLLLVVSPESTILKRVFQHTVFVWLGEFSYTLYLFHLVFVVAASMYLKSMGFDGLKLFAMSFVFSPVTLLACFGLYWVVERPLLVRRPAAPVQPQVATV